MMRIRVQCNRLTDGLLLSQVFGNGLIETRNYELQGRLLDQDIDGVLSKSYSYDANGNRLTYSNDDYVYSPKSNILVSVDSESVITDAVGNITHLRNLILTYNNAGKINSIENVTIGELSSYVYHAYGQSTRKVTTITCGSEFVYLHTDSINMPRSATDGATEVVWDYDSFGRTPANENPDGDSTAL